MFQCKISDSIKGLICLQGTVQLAIYTQFFVLKKTCNWTGEGFLKKDCDLDLHTWSLAVKSLGRIYKASIAALNLILHVSSQILRL